MKDVIILGAGTAGMSAALYAKRYGLDTVVVEQNMAGGQIVNTPDVENYPGIMKVSGFEFALKLMEQINALGVDITYQNITKYELLGDVKRIHFGDQVLEAKTVIIANGVERRKLGVTGEDEFSGRGVSYCATCDGAFFKDKVTAIVGGGNTALEDALFLAGNCKKVYLIHRRDEFRGNQILVDRIKTRDNIEILYTSKITEIKGEASVTSIDVDVRGEVKNFEVDGVFVAVGQVSNNGPFEGVIDLDEAGFIIANEDAKTNVEGVFVAGDTRTKILRQLITAAADGAIAASQCASYIL